MLTSLPTELKLSILHHLDEPSLSALLRACPFYNHIFNRYRSELHTAVTLNTLHARDLALQLRTKMHWLEVSLTIPKPHSESIRLA